MSTNYYWHPADEGACPTCGRRGEAEAIHIGKSSPGWTFALHVTEELTSLSGWIIKILTGSIEDEYGKSVTSEEMIQVITERSRPPELRDPPEGFHRRNHSQPGPNGLVRRQIGNLCVGHGKGTWDLVTGEFS